MTAQHEVDEAKIRRHIGKIAEGLQDKDLEGLKRLYATDIVSFDVQPPLQHVGVEAKLRNWAPVFTSFETVTYEVRDLTLTVGDELAFGHAFARLGGTLEDGTPISGMWVRVTYCLRKIDGTWLIVHDQVSVPLDVSTGTGVIDLEP
ncbi:YybH family protein [Streptomyces sp. NPDC001843]|uniref:YybH family protein n=1 Tax=Streptomyces sp. NPDC001843 TaxID=3364617 RepID=UPI0036B80421